MAYPEGEMQYIWDGRGTIGASAACVITANEIQLKPRKVIGSVLGWPELVLPRKEIRGVEALFFSDYRFRLTSELLGRSLFPADRIKAGVPVCPGTAEHPGRSTLLERQAGARAADVLESHALGREHSLDAIGIDGGMNAYKRILCPAAISMRRCD